MMPMTMQHDPIHMVVPLSPPPKAVIAREQCPFALIPPGAADQLAVEPLPKRTEICA